MPSWLRLLLRYPQNLLKYVTKPCFWHTQISIYDYLKKSIFWGLNSFLTVFAKTLKSMFVTFVYPPSYSHLGVGVTNEDFGPGPASPPKSSFFIDQIDFYRFLMFFPCFFKNTCFLQFFIKKTLPWLLYISIKTCYVTPKTHILIPCFQNISSSIDTYNQIYLSPFLEVTVKIP